MTQEGSVWLPPCEAEFGGIQTGSIITVGEDSPKDNFARCALYNCGVVQVEPRDVERDINLGTVFCATRLGAICQFRDEAEQA